MLTFAQPNAEDVFTQLGLDGQQFAALQLAVSESSTEQTLTLFGLRVIALQQYCGT